MTPPQEALSVTVVSIVTAGALTLNDSVWAKCITADPKRPAMV